MLLAMKVAPRDVQMFLDNIGELEKDGIIVNGFELQITPSDTQQTALEAIDFLGKTFKFRGLHPPFPTSADGNFIHWDEVSGKANLDYTVLHAAADKLKDISSAITSAIKNSTSTPLLENLPIRSDRLTIGSLIDAGNLSDNLLMDIPHTLHNWYEKKLEETPLKQIEAVFDKIKAVHVADNDNGFGLVPLGGGSQDFQDILKKLYQKKDCMFIAEPSNGHKNYGVGHKETIREIWKLWETF
ncbi:MAG: hypothetical protein GOU98_01900 [Candidatus Altiarchaeota archaeon]|nr:hypothetical protein [Candidatus Altiarchaeota archaeon]